MYIYMYIYIHIYIYIYLRCIYIFGKTDTTEVKGATSFAHH